ncbi:MAG: hypothetical protein ABSD64_14435 [Terriglobales bacterium]|jgi:hypothetical protein
MATLKLLFGLAILGAMVLVGVKVIPPYFSNYEFEDAIKEEALQSTYTNRTEEDIRETVVKLARKYDIEITPKQVHVARVGVNLNGSLAIDVEYSVPLDLPGYSTTLNFHPATTNKSVY